MTETPACPKCHRSDCPLLADVIYGVAKWLAAFVNCMRHRGAA